MTLSTPVKIVVLAALALILGLGGLLLIAGRHSASGGEVITPPQPVVHHTAAPVAKANPKPHVAPVRIDPGVPLIIARALRMHPVAVVVVYSSRNAGDRAVLAEARAGAHASHAAFVAADVAREGVAKGISTWSSTPAVPAVGVVRRPGKVVFLVAGATDRQTVAQAALTAR